MPGISVRYRHPTVSSPLDERLEPVLHDGRYEATVVRDDGASQVGYTGYEEYPVEEFRIDDYHVVFEGYVYDWNGVDPRSKLRELLLDRFDRFDDTDAIADWVRSVDGEFVLVAVDETTEEITVLGDCLGRLPLYHAATETNVAISREHRFVVECLTNDRVPSQPEADGGVVRGTTEPPRVEPTPAADVHGLDRNVEFDRTAIAQFLLFGHTLGRRTLVAGVERLPPAPFVRITDEEMTVECLHEFDFETKTHRNESLEANAAALAELFDRACRTRARIEDATRSRPSTPNLVSLSGGLDSRAVLSSFAEQDLPCVAATMDYGGVKESDVAVANELTTRYGIDWEYYSLSPPDASVVRKHIRMKDARDPLMPYLLVFFDELADKHGTVTYMTGAGGDMVLPDLRPPKHLSDVDAVVEHLIDGSHRYSIDDVAAITGLPVEQIRRSVRDRIEEYPETDPAQLYVHFRIYERARNWLFEAEDTNRGYFWSTTPFYSLPFFEYAMNCPDAQKRWYRLYAAFLGHLSADAPVPPNANFAVAPASPLHTLAAFAFETVQRFPAVFDTVKPTIRRLLNAEIRTDPESAPLECISDQLDASPAIGDVLSIPVLRRLLDPSNDAGYGRRDVYLLLTLCSYIDEITAETTVLERSGDLVFD